MELSLLGAPQFTAVAKQLRGPAMKQVRTDLTKAMRATAQPAVVDLRKVVRSLPVTGTPGGGTAQRQAYRASKSKGGKARARGLRATTASAIRLQARYGRWPGFRIVVSKSAFPKAQAKLPQYLNRPEGWRHPLYGNRKFWYAQRGRPWFDVTLRQHYPRMRRDGIRALQATLDVIAREAGRG